MIPDPHAADAAQTSGRHGQPVSGTADSQSGTGVVPRPVGCLTWAAAVRWGICAGYVALITWLSLAPSMIFLPALAPLPQADKLAHFLMYGFLVVLVRWALAGRGLRWHPQGLWVPLTALIYGALMELAQLLLVPADRSFEVGDMLANGLGALVFWGAGNLWSLCRRRANLTLTTDFQFQPFSPLLFAICYLRSYLWRISAFNFLLLICVLFALNFVLSAFIPHPCAISRFSFHPSAFGFPLSAFYFLLLIFVLSTFCFSACRCLQPY